MTGATGFTQTIDWLAFTIPTIAVDEVIKTIGGDWFQSETGFRGYPKAQLMTQGKTGVGKLGTSAPRNPKEVHVDLSAGIVSQWDEARLKQMLRWIFDQKDHVTRIAPEFEHRRLQAPCKNIFVAHVVIGRQNQQHRVRISMQDVQKRQQDAGCRAAISRLRDQVRRRDIEMQ